MPYPQTGVNVALDMARMEEMDSIADMSGELQPGNLSSQLQLGNMSSSMDPGNLGSKLQLGNMSSSLEPGNLRTLNLSNISDMIQTSRMNLTA